MSLWYLRRLNPVLFVIAYFAVLCLSFDTSIMLKASIFNRVNARSLSQLGTGRIYSPFVMKRLFSSSTESSTLNKVNEASEIYKHLDVEKKWQSYWDENNTFDSTLRRNPMKKYVLDMFPYPSGAGLHVGHPEGYTATDIMSRYWRMCGFDVLHPMGWDAFGLPAEQHAINTGTHPAKTTLLNIANFKRQLKSLGFSYDW